MCGRFTLHEGWDNLQQRFSFSDTRIEYRPHYNIAPTQDVLTITNDGENHGGYMRWGMIPSWAKDASIGNRMINARGETVTERPAFRDALRMKRCLVIADGFYEWRKEGKSRTPMRITLREEEPFAFAGLWAVWKNPSNEWVRSCTIMTTEPNALIAPIHDRMPVILPQEAEATWLDPKIHDLMVLTSFFKPFPGEAMVAYEVSSRVNTPANDDPECIRLVDGRGGAEDGQPAPGMSRLL